MMILDTRNRDGAPMGGASEDDFVGVSDPTSPEGSAGAGEVSSDSTVAPAPKAKAPAKKAAKVEEPVDDSVNVEDIPF